MGEQNSLLALWDCIAFRMPHTYTTIILTRIIYEDIYPLFMYAHYFITHTVD